METCGTPGPVVRVEYFVFVFGMLLYGERATPVVEMRGEGQWGEVLSSFVPVFPVGKVMGGKVDPGMPSRVVTWVVPFGLFVSCEVGV